MSTPLPGQIRCPTCHRSTPPAAFCTQCGTAIPASFRARPRGLDREELQDRIRVHRPGDAAFRRGSTVGEAAVAGQSAYQPFRPEPEDELVLQGAEPAEGAPHVDNTPPGFDERQALCESLGVGAFVMQGKARQQSERLFVVASLENQRLLKREDRDHASLSAARHSRPSSRQCPSEVPRP